MYLRGGAAEGLDHPFPPGSRANHAQVASVNNASIRWHYSTQRPGGWPTGMLQKLGLEALQHKWPQASRGQAPCCPAVPLLPTLSFAWQLARLSDC